MTMKSEVLLIRDEFALIMLKGAARGKLAYVPTRQVGKPPSFVCVIWLGFVNLSMVIKRKCPIRRKKNVMAT